MLPTQQIVQYVNMENSNQLNCCKIYCAFSLIAAQKKNRYFFFHNLLM